MKDIKDVRVGSNPKVIAIVIDQSNTHDSVIVFSLSKGREKECFDVVKDHEIMWDLKGDPYI